MVVCSYGGALSQQLLGPWRVLLDESIPRTLDDAILESLCDGIVGLCAGTVKSNGKAKGKKGEVHGNPQAPQLDRGVLRECVCCCAHLSDAELTVMVKSAILVETSQADALYERATALVRQCAEGAVRSPSHPSGDDAAVKDPTGEEGCDESNDDADVDFSKLKVAELKARLKGHNLATTGLKKDLVARLTSHVASKRTCVVGAAAAPTQLNSASKVQRRAGTTAAPESRPLVLILDEQLTQLPWESMPVLQKRSVSRALSLVHLLASHLMHSGGSGDGVAHASMRKAFYIIDPEDNLPATRETIGKYVAAKPKALNWDGVVGSAPSAEELRFVANVIISAGCRWYSALVESGGSAHALTHASARGSASGVCWSRRGRSSTSATEPARRSLAATS